MVTSYSEKHPVTTSEPVDVLESRPRPLEFEERLHKSLNSELKYLYTAITRAKCNLWLYDASESKRLPMFDYWVRRGLVRVVKMGEKEEDDKVLFTATSTPEQWELQGDYFKRKGLWEPAIKCYHKAGATLKEKEAEAYLFVQKGKIAQSTREMQLKFEKAAEAFLLCDHKEHNVKYLTNATKCLKTAKKYSEAAKLFEKLEKVRHYTVIGASPTVIVTTARSPWVYVAVGSVCRFNVPESTPIHVAHVHIGNAHGCTKYWTCWTQRMSTMSSTATKKRLEKLGWVRDSVTVDVLLPVAML